MGEQGSLVDACRTVGLGCRCEHLHAEPRFRISIDQHADPPLLRLTIRNDDSIVPRFLHVDPDVPAVLFEVTEETVYREPAMSIWLPATEHHRYVVWREGECWRAGKLGEIDRVATAGEAVQAVRSQSSKEASGS